MIVLHRFHTSMGRLQKELEALHKSATVCSMSSIYTVTVGEIARLVMALCCFMQVRY